MAVDQVGALWDELDALDKKARSLRSESNEIVAFVPGPDGAPVQDVSDPIRFRQIGHELEAIREKKMSIEAKLEKIKKVAGNNQDGVLRRLDPDRTRNYIDARRMCYCKDLFRLMSERHTPFLVGEVTNVMAYQALENDIGEEIRRGEAQIIEERELMLQIINILAE